MMKAIGSIYIIKRLFSNLDELKKFKIIKYNKELQRNLNINLLNYMYLSGRHIIYELDGNAKEYDDDGTLLFEGKYLNGKRKKGKEYNESGEILFEGEYSNGKRWIGEVKELYEDGSIEFEGEYLDGERKWKWKTIL